jgi:hypothetical protein
MPDGSLIHGATGVAGEAAVEGAGELVVLAVVVEALLGAVDAEVGGFEGVCALAARVAAATMRARRERFMAKKISN